MAGQQLACRLARRGVQTVPPYDGQAVSWRFGYPVTSSTCCGIGYRLTQAKTSREDLGSSHAEVCCRRGCAKGPFAVAVSRGEAAFRRPLATPAVCRAARSLIRPLQRNGKGSHPPALRLVPLRSPSAKPVGLALETDSGFLGVRCGRTGQSGRSFTMTKWCQKCMRQTRHIKVRAGTIRCEVCGTESIG